MTLEPARILIVRLGSLGDLIHTLPALAELHDAWPHAEIDWVVEQGHADLLALVPILSRVVILGDRTPAGWWEVIRTLRARQYDVAIDLQGLVKSASLARFSSAKRVVGFDADGLRERAARLFYTETVEVGDDHHVIDKNLALVRGLTKRTSGVVSGSSGNPGFQVETPVSTQPGNDSRGPFTGARRFPLKEPASPALQSLRAQGVQEFAAINPGAAWPNKRWPPDSFAAVALFIHEKYGWTPVVLWGPGEQEIAQAICDATGGIARCAPPTRLADLVAIARAAKLFVSGDTGPLHIAGATGTPIVALFGPTSPARNGPWDHRDVSISRYDSCACHYKRACQREHNWCLGQISVDEVMRAIERRMGS
jgi:lipopolysaccharide heptosyltransferase I